MTQANTLLKELGLTPNQTYIYLYLAKHGRSKAGEIIKATGFHRNIVYGTLEELMDKRLVGSAKERGVLVYKIFDPNRIIAEQEDRVRKAKDLVGELSKYKKLINPHEIVIYEGQRDLATQARRTYEAMPKGGMARTLGFSPLWYELVGKDLEDELSKIQFEKQFRWRGLAKVICEGDRRLMESLGDLMCVKTTPLIEDDTSSIEILEDRISIRSLVEPYMVVVIVNERLAKNFQRYFDFIWESVDLLDSGTKEFSVDMVKGKLK